MKKFLTIFFVTLGVTFFCILAIGTYVWFADPFEIRPVISTFMRKDTATSSVTQKQDTNKNPALSAEQERMLETVGIDPAQVPTSISPTQEACFIAKLGEARVAEIKAGSAPTVVELYSAKSCIE